MEKRVRATKKGNKIVSVAPVKDSERNYKTELERPLDYDIIGKLAEKQYSGVEIAATISMNRQTWQRRLKVDETLRDAVADGKERGKAILRKSMYDKAVKDGNTTMMIWLSKNYLGMADKAEIDVGDKKPTGVLVVPSQTTPEQWAKTNGAVEISEYDETPKSNVVS